MKTFSIVSMWFCVTVWATIGIGALIKRCHGEAKDKERAKVLLAEADKDWIDTQIGWELERHGLHVYCVMTWEPDQDARVMRSKKIGVVIASSMEEAECQLEERKRANGSK